MLRAEGCADPMASFASKVSRSGECGRVSLLLVTDRLFARFARLLPAKGTAGKALPSMREASAVPT